jgi:hypothetical protein
MITMSIDLPPNIDPTDRSTWIDPVVTRKMRAMGAHVYRAEYTIPVTPNALIMAVIQLPEYVPKGNPTFIRVLQTKSNIGRDGRNKGGFAVEAHWPLGDIFDSLDAEVDGS